MKRLPCIGILVLIILGLAGSYYSAVASAATGATVPVPEPVLMILLGTGFIALAGLGKKWFYGSVQNG